MKLIILLLLSGHAIHAQTQDEFSPDTSFGDSQALEREEQFLNEEQAPEQQQDFNSNEFGDESFEVDEQYLEDSQVDPERQQLQQDLQEQDEQEFIDESGFESDPGNFDTEVDSEF